MHRSDVVPLLDVAMFQLQVKNPNMSSETFEALKKVFSNYIQNKVGLDECKSIVESLIGDTEEVEKVHKVLTVPEEPLTEFNEGDSKGWARKKAHPWTEEEDRRLLYAITKFGLSDWAESSKFVGNGRSRSQCSQRWHRSLNPRISKDRWLPEEDELLLKSIKTYGDKAWTKVAQAIGCRTDVQCRYRYMLIGKKSQYPAISVSNDCVRHSQQLAPVGQCLGNFASMYLTHGAGYQQPQGDQSSTKGSLFNEFLNDDNSNSEQNCNEVFVCSYDDLWEDIFSGTSDESNQNQHNSHTNEKHALF